MVVDPLRVISANVNGIRAAARKGGLEQLLRLEPDVVCMQEVRASGAQLVTALADAGFTSYALVHAGSTTPGRNGVAILSRYPLLASDDDLAAGFAGHGRWIEAQVAGPNGPLWLASAYVPKGGDAESLAGKRDFLDRVTARLAQRLTDGDPALMAGDINVARTPMDLRNWRDRVGKSGFLDWERAFLDGWESLGWVDLGRALAGPGPGPYTWWSNRGRAFDNDSGWRIDHVWASPDLASLAESARVDKAPSWDTRWSDHAAVVIDFRD